MLDHLKTVLGPRMPRYVMVATVFFKSKRNKTDRVPDFFVEDTDAWLVFPHELAELTDAEVALFRPNAYRMAQELL